MLLLLCSWDGFERREEEFLPPDSSVNHETNPARPVKCGRDGVHLLPNVFIVARGKQREEKGKNWTNKHVQMFSVLSRMAAASLWIFGGVKRLSAPREGKKKSFIFRLCVSPVGDRYERRCQQTQPRCLARERERERSAVPCIDEDTTSVIWERERREKKTGRGKTGGASLNYAVSISPFREDRSISHAKNH